MYAIEECQTLEQQFAMQQNFIKLVDKNIDDMEKDIKFLNQAEEQIKKNDGDTDLYHNPRGDPWQNGHRGHYNNQLMGNDKQQRDSEGRYSSRGQTIGANRAGRQAQPYEESTRNGRALGSAGQMQKRTSQIPKTPHQN